MHILLLALASWNYATPGNTQVGFTSGTPLTYTTDIAFYEGLALLGQSHPDIANAIEQAIVNQTMTVGELTSPSTFDGYSDGDTMLINFKANGRPAELASVILHEWAHVNGGANGHLGSCAHAVAFHAQITEACEASCIAPPGAHQQKISSWMNMMLKFQIQCAVGGGTPPTAPINCPCIFD